MSETGWRQPSFQSSNDGTHCAEIRPTHGGVLVRSSLRPGEVVLLNEGEFDALRKGIQAGEFDDM